MARAAYGTPWTIYGSDEDVGYISTTIAGKRHRASLGIPYAKDPAARSASNERLAQEKAAEKYAQLVSGRSVEKLGARVTTQLTLHELFSLWLAEVKRLYKGWKTVVTYVRTYERVAEDSCGKRTPLEWIVSDEGVRAFAIARLGGAVRDTVKKEVCRLFGFFAWCVDGKHLAHEPKRPSLPRGATGTRTGTQRAKPVQVTDAEALAIIDTLPETSRSKKKKGEPFPVRDAFRFSYETGLRPGTVARVSIPTHWTPARPEWLRITPDIDKVQNGREVRLSKVAQGILARWAPKAGVVFGAHDMRIQLKAAAAKVLPADRAKDFARYDLRHGRARVLLDASGDLRGTAHQLGHTQITTTNRYLRTDEDAGARAVIAAERVRVLSDLPSDRDSAPSEIIDLSSDSEEVRRAGLEPARFYPLAPQSSRNAESLGNLRLLTTSRGSQTPIKIAGGVLQLSEFCQTAGLHLEIAKYAAAWPGDA